MNFLKQMKNLKIEILSKSNKFDENVKIMKKIKQRDYVIALDSQVVLIVLNFRI